MKLYILRHGDAAEHGDPRYKETERPLTPKGIKRTKLLAHALRRMDVKFDAVLSSPLVRARQTAELIVKGMQLEPGRLKLTDHLTPDGSMEELVHEISAIRPAPESVLLTGHEPYLSGFISLLCTGGPGLHLIFKKGALCRLDVEEPSCHKCASLDWLVQPRLLGFNTAR